jgi:hypothetical protein
VLAAHARQQRRVQLQQGLGVGQKGARQGGVHDLLLLGRGADAVGQHLLALDRDHRLAVLVVEAHAEDAALGGQLLGGAVEDCGAGGRQGW